MGVFVAGGVDCRRPQVSKLIVLDPRQRLSVREALDHPWVLGKAARFSHMDTTQRKLQEFNARRKLKVRLSSGGSEVSGVDLSDRGPRR